jgi:hypothetical protein
MADIAEVRARIEELSPEDELRLLERLVEAGWSPGCWLRGIEDSILSGSPDEIGELLDACSARKGMRPEQYEDPHAWGLPSSPVTGTDPVWIVLSQRCDIAADLRNEPVVELARAYLETDKGRLNKWYWGSTRFFPIEPGVVPCYCVDLRVRHLMSKLELDDLTPAQALPDNGVIRGRFSRRAGMRYSRAAVPDQAVVELVKPLHELLAQRPRANEILADVYLDPGEAEDKRFGLLFVTRSDEDVPEADDMWQEIAEELQGRSAMLDIEDQERNGVIAYDDFTLPRWERVSRVGDDEASYRSDEAAQPLP